MQPAVEDGRSSPTAAAKAAKVKPEKQADLAKQTRARVEDVQRASGKAKAVVSTKGVIEW
jgi:hypothetical protein